MKPIVPHNLLSTSALHRQGTMVTLAGKTAYLPNNDMPIIVQNLTEKQIDAIPRDKYSISLLAVSSKVAIPFKDEYGRKHLALTKPRLRKGLPLIRRSTTHHYIGRRSIGKLVNDDGTKEYTAIVAMANQVIDNAGKLYYNGRQQIRNNSLTPEFNIFYPPIDEGKMSDCIMEAVVHYFGDTDKCKICNREYKLPTFCLLMYYYFIRIGILKNTTRKHFSDFLTDKVLTNHPLKFTTKTFNNYANEYQNYEEDFTNPHKLSINFKVHPEPSGQPLQNAFHEIGNFFHSSDYFEYLRKVKNNMEKFQL